MKQQQMCVGNVSYPKQKQMFKGGGSATPAAPPTPAPPVQAVSADINVAKKEAIKSASKRRGAASTVLAGETMPNKRGAAASLLAGETQAAQIEKKTLLG